MTSNENLVSRRFRLLIEQLGAEEGRPARGWQSRVAKRLGMDRSYLAKVLHGDREVGVAAAESAARALNIPLEFFTNEGHDRNYASYLDRPQDVFDQRLRRAANPWKIAASFAMPDLAKMPPEDQRKWLEQLVTDYRSRNTEAHAANLELALRVGDQAAVYQAGVGFLLALDRERRLIESGDVHDPDPRVKKEPLLR